MQASSGTPVANLRGIGAMIGFDVVKTRGGKEPDGAMVKRILATALKRGLLCIGCGVHGETIRLLVPLTISDQDLAAGLAILAKAIAQPE
jgi:4-aminobutyrate aminotransferase / (S)-3-amino-2-methylpropionate transaminase / 5-aminovalerate transaminase